MDEKSPRYIARTNRVFARSRDVVAEPIKKVEEQIIPGPNYPMVKSILVTDGFLCTEGRRPKGVIDPPHLHSDHESVFYLISGKLKLTIGGQVFIAEPGDYWVHPKGVLHHTEMLEESVNIEVKIPPVKTWNHP